jgi:hypothetical protein
MWFKVLTTVVMNSSIFWDITDVPEEYANSESSIDFQEATWCDIHKDRNLHACISSLNPIIILLSRIFLAHLFPIFWRQCIPCRGIETFLLVKKISTRHKMLLNGYCSYFTYGGLRFDSHPKAIWKIFTYDVFSPFEEYSETPSNMSLWLFNSYFQFIIRNRSSISSHVTYANVKALLKKLRNKHLMTFHCAGEACHSHTSRGNFAKCPAFPSLTVMLLILCNINKPLSSWQEFWTLHFMWLYYDCPFGYLTEFSEF